MHTEDGREVSRSLMKVMLSDEAGRALLELRRRLDLSTNENRVKFAEAMHYLTWLGAEQQQLLDASMTLGARIGNRQHAEFLLCHCRTTLESYERARVLFANEGMDIDKFIGKPERFKVIGRNIDVLNELIAAIDDGTFEQDKFDAVALAHTDGDDPATVAADLAAQLKETSQCR